jgi:hypothetical protein
MYIRKVKLCVSREWETYDLVERVYHSAFLGIPADARVRREVMAMVDVFIVAFVGRGNLSSY